MLPLGETMKNSTFQNSVNSNESNLQNGNQMLISFEKPKNLLAKNVNATNYISNSKRLLRSKQTSGDTSPNPELAETMLSSINAGLNSSKDEIALSKRQYYRNIAEA